MRVLCLLVAVGLVAGDGPGHHHDHHHKSHHAENHEHGHAAAGHDDSHEHHAGSHHATKNAAGNHAHHHAKHAADAHGTKHAVARDEQHAHHHAKNAHHGAKHAAHPTTQQQAHHAPQQRQRLQNPQAVRPVAPRQVQRRQQSPLQQLLARPLNLPRLPANLRPQRFQLPVVSPFANKRKSNTKNRLRKQQPSKLTGRIRNVAKLPKIAYVAAEKIPGYSKFQLHEVIRRREGTEIFDDHKPDVIHYVDAPDAAQNDLTSKIDERTPNKIDIDAV